MRKPERSAYTPLDFLSWAESGTLVLTPKFQRRGVWTTPARSYLIDTLLLGMPVPPVFLRVRQSDDRKKMIREVIDGQQRISAVVDYISGKYALSSNISAAYAGRYFNQLTREQQDAIRQYSFICEVFFGLEDAEVLQIFSRLNTYSVPLNAQELRNGRFFGPFKRSAYELALEHLQFWRKHGVFSERNIARMAEVELTSELMILQIDGLQDKKKSIDSFYAKYDEQFPQRDGTETRFRSVIDHISEHVGEWLGRSEFSRPPLFYTLFGAVFHRMYGMPKQELPAPATGGLSRIEGERLRDAILYLSEQIGLAKQSEEIPEQLERFVVACLRQTDNLRPRQIRLTEVYQRAFG